MSEKTVSRLHGVWHIEYEYSIGVMAATFFERLIEGVLIGAECRGCDRVYVPPKGFCEHCFTKLEQVVEVGQRGKIEAVTIVTTPFKGSPDVPYCVAYVRLEGATSSIANFIRDVKLDDQARIPDVLQVGSEVKVVFADRREGRMTDFWFAPGE